MEVDLHPYLRMMIFSLFLFLKMENLQKNIMSLNSMVSMELKL
jgi:hypothetical protein